MRALTNLQNSVSLQLASNNEVFDRMSVVTKRAFAAISISVIAAAASNGAMAANCGAGYSGPTIGGIAGALLGSQVGGGNGRLVATGVGAIVGSITGDRVAAGGCDNSSRQDSSQELAQLEARREQLIRNRQAQEELLRQEALRQQEMRLQREAQIRESQTSTICAPSQERSMTGSITGGVVGALLGSRIGKGNGNAAAIGAGAIAGAITGDRIDNRGQNCQVVSTRATDYGSRDRVGLSYSEGQMVSQRTLNAMIAKIQWEDSVASVQAYLLKHKIQNSNMSSKMDREGTDLLETESQNREQFVQEREVLVRTLNSLASSGSNRDLTAYTPVISGLLATPTTGVISAKSLLAQEQILRADPTYEKFYQKAFEQSGVQQDMTMPSNKARISL